MNAPRNALSERPQASGAALTKQDRPWYRWRAITWLAVILTAVAVGYCHWVGLTARDANAPFLGSRKVARIDHFGWPCVELIVDTAPTGPATAAVSSTIRPIGLLANTLVAALLLVWIVLVAERMDRTAGRSTGGQILAVCAMLGGTVLLWRLREPIWERLVAVLPTDFTDVFDTVTDPRPGWMHILHYGLSIAIVNALVVVAWCSGAGIIARLRPAALAQEAK